MTSGSVLRLPLTHDDRALDGSSTTITLPANADNTPLGADFWGDILGFNPAHSPQSFAIVDSSENVYPVVGPDPPYPVNAPCWLVKGPHSLWYAGNSPGHAISIFFSDDKGGAFYKSIPLPGAPTDITVSPDGNWLAVIYTASDGAHIAVYSIDKFGDLTPAATSPAVGVASFSGVDTFEPITRSRTLLPQPKEDVKSRKPALSLSTLSILFHFRGLLLEQRNPHKSSLPSRRQYDHDQTSGQGLYL